MSEHDDLVVIGSGAAAEARPAGGSPSSIIVRSAHVRLVPDYTDLDLTIGGIIEERGRFRLTLHAAGMQPRLVRR